MIAQPTAQPKPRSVVRRLFRFGLFVALFLLASAGGTMSYFHFAPPSQTCVTCHEMQGQHDRWAASAHKEVHCRNCHGGSLTLDVHALKEHVDRVVGHFDEQRRRHQQLTHEQVLAVSNRCRDCHRNEFAKWSASGHGVGFQAIFLNESQNKREQPNGDCLRCHGMFYEGTTESLVTPLDTKGPWQLQHPEMAHQPVLPCLVCHKVHEPQPSAQRPDRPVAAQFYSRHEKTHFALDNLPVPAIQRDGKPVRVSSDPKQRLCAQCHAPNAEHDLASRDDRTPAGVHEGLSCAACHDPHSNDARAACAACHPGIQHCGMDVRTMDTSFKSAPSKHNIHTVSCGDCHGGKRPGAQAATSPTGSTGVPPVSGVTQ